MVTTACPWKTGGDMYCVWRISRPCCQLRRGSCQHNLRTGSSLRIVNKVAFEREKLSEKALSTCGSSANSKNLKSGHAAITLEKSSSTCVRDPWNIPELWWQSMPIRSAGRPPTLLPLCMTRPTLFETNPDSYHVRMRRTRPTNTRSPRPARVHTCAPDAAGAPRALSCGKRERRTRAGTPPMIE